MRLYKRNETYWFELEFENKRYRQSTRVKNKVKAEGIAAAFRTKLAEGRAGLDVRTPAPVFEDAVKAFLAWSETEHQEHPRTYRRYKTSSKPVLAFHKFKGKRMDAITPAMIEDYKQHRGRQSSKRTKKAITPATINRELALLKAVYFHAQKADRHILNPVCDVEFLPENNEQDRILSYDEQRRYLAVASPTLKDIARLMLETGMRPEEVCRIQKQNVVLHGERPYVYIPFGKTKAARRRVPVNQAAVEILQKRLDQAEGIYLFPHRKDANKPMLKVNNAHTTALKASKVRYFRLYDCRHTFATRAVENGMDNLATLAAILGHSKLNMVMRYAHPQERHKAEAMARLEKANAAAEIAEFEREKVHTKTHTEEILSEVDTVIN